MGRSWGDVETVDSDDEGRSVEYQKAYDDFQRFRAKTGAIREDPPRTGGRPRTDYALIWRGHDIVLPAIGAGEDDALGFTTWHDSRDNLAALTLEVLENRALEPGKCIPTEIALLHRADNSYNSRAISVAMTDSPFELGLLSRRRLVNDMAVVKARHIGYLSDKVLRAVGVEALPSLVALAASRGGEVRCTGLVWGPDDLMLDLPVERVLATAIEDFLSENGIDAWTLPREHRSRSEKTTRALRWLFRFDEEPVAVSNVIVRTVNHPSGRRALSVVDQETLSPLGSVIDGHLILEDERLRDPLLALLDAADAPVARPTSLPSSVAVVDAIANLDVIWASGGFHVRTKDPKNTKYDSIAQYNSRSQRLWVEDSRLVAATASYVARLGFEVASIGLPERPWKLYPEVSAHLLLDPHASLVDHSRPVLRLLETHRPLVREDSLQVTEWVDASPETRRLRNPDDDRWWLLERHVREREALFPGAELRKTIESCRLCGCDAIRFATSVCTEELAYCGTCLVFASEGAESRGGLKRVAEVVGELAELEFDGSPMLEDQLSALHINPEQPVSSRRIDQLLLLRFAIRRGKHPWTRVLERSGVSSGGLRLARGTLIRARDGHLCLSLRERAVCDFLHQHGVEHEREPLYPADPALNPHGRRRADWVLADGTFVELWGLPDDPAYAAKMVEKRRLAERHGLRLVELTDAELPHLPRVFAEWLPDGGSSGSSTTWVWSPRLITAPPLQPPAGPRASRSSNNGKNGYNDAARRGRLARLEQALALSQQGLTNREVAAELGSSLETAETLLQDARFYADPQRNPQRLRWVEAAVTARQKGTSRSQFAAEHRVSAQKAKQIWRDADVMGVEEADPS